MAQTSSGPANRAPEPAFALTYGSSGAGKTSDSGFSFPCGLFIAARGALQPLRHVIGYEPACIEAKSIEDATKIITATASNGKCPYDAIVVDDFSFLAEQTFSLLERRANGWRLWGLLRDVTLDFRNAARYASCHVILNCWEQAPATKPDGTRVRGGPMLSGKLPEQLPALCDLVLRCGFDAGRKPWPGVYRCFPSQEFTMKDRFGIVPDPAPMNLAEIFRLAGYTVRRHPAVEAWQEQVVTQIAAALLASDPARMQDIANAFYKDLVANGIEPKAARWTLRDALDRVVLRRANEARQAQFISV